MSERRLITSEWLEKPCDICGSGLTESLGRRKYILPGSNGDYEFVHEDVICSSCGFVFAGRIPDQEFLAGFYRQTSTPCLPTFDIDARLEIIRRYLKPGESILELGSNAGEFAAALSKEGYEVECHDLIDNKDNAPENSTFDMVAGYYILEHIPYPRKWVLESRNYLKPDGILVLEVPNFARTPGPSMFPEHLVHFSPDHMRMLLESTGFEFLHWERGKHSRYFGFIAVAKFILQTRLEFLKRQYNNP